MSKHHDERTGQFDAKHDKVIADRNAKAKIIADQWDSLTLLQKWQATSNPALDPLVSQQHFADSQAYARFINGEGEWGLYLADGVTPNPNSTANFSAQPLDPLIVKVYGTDQGHQNPDNPKNAPGHHHSKK